MFKYLTLIKILTLIKNADRGFISEAFLGFIYFWKIQVKLVIMGCRNCYFVSTKFYIG